MIKKILQAYISFFQKLLVTTALFFIYFIGFGITAALAVLFGRAFLCRPAAGSGRTLWVKAEGYEKDADNCLRES